VYKKSLKIPKVQSEYANTRRTEKIKGKKTKGQTTIYKTQHRKLKIEKDQPHWKQGVNSGVQDWLVVPDALVAPVVLL